MLESDFKGKMELCPIMFILHDENVLKCTKNLRENHLWYYTYKHEPYGP